MELTQLIERTLGLAFLLIGLSHAAQPARWGELFADVLAKPHGALLIATLSLPLALVLVVGHPGWTPDGRSVVTLYGWLLLAKCAAYLLVPGVSRRVVPATLHTGRGFRPAGAVMVALGAVVLHASLGA